MIEQADKALPDRMRTVEALMAKIHELSLASGLAQSEEPACDDRIATRIGADKKMVARFEQRNFQDVGALFEELCKGRQ